MEDKILYNPGVLDLRPESPFGEIHGCEMVSDKYEPLQDGGCGKERRIRLGNNRYHIPKSEARAKRKARKQAQKAARRQG